ncbi:MAG: hypothetical protein E7021_02175 [Alphaproteobacteria bacterium]|nr:hypothetical protein [Alphaproteobacteria bacterium]
MKPTKKSLLKTLFISALAGLSVLGGCKKNQSNNVPQKGDGTRPSVEEMWKEAAEVKKWIKENIQHSTKQRD